MKKLAKKTTTVKKYQTGGKTDAQRKKEMDSWKKEVEQKKRDEGMSRLKYLKSLHTTDLVGASRRGDKDPMKTAQGSIQGYEDARGKGSFMRDVKRSSAQAYGLKDVKKKGGAVKSKKK